MDKKILLLIFISLMIGCGDLGNSSNENSNTNNQIFNPDPISCSTSCTYSPETGEISAIRECSGSAPLGIPIISLDACDDITELPAEEEEE